MSAIQKISTPAPVIQGGTEFSLSDKDFRALADILYNDTGIALSDGKKSLVYSRLVKRLRALKLESFKAYRELIDSQEGEIERSQMIFSLTTNVTAFFREPHHFNQLMDEVLPPLVESAKSGGRVRIWSAGCSNGQEPYSIAFSLLTVFPEAANYNVKILATDIDSVMIEQAKRGIYSSRNIEGVPATMKSRFLTKEGDDEWRVTEKPRELITFNRLNLIRPWPVKGPFDTIFCRNVVIYFDDPTKEKMWSAFTNHLTPKGYLFIGHSERVAGRALSDVSSVGVTAYRRK